MAVKNYLSSGDSNAKTAKNKRETLILYLSPHTSNEYGINLCPMASDGCVSSCLFTAGRGAMANVAKARMDKTKSYLDDRASFLMNVARQINHAASKIGNKQLAVRLNGTSDTRLVELLLESFAIAKNVVFYDYTKIKKKAGDRSIKGHRYMVTFSRSERNDKDCIDVLKSGGVVAVVFDSLPKLWNGFPVIDGDQRDDLMLDIDGGIVLGLKAKGKAKHDNTGFVIKSKSI